MLLQQRLASGSQASCSYTSRPFVSHARRPDAAALARQSHYKCSRRGSHVCRVAEVDEAEELDELDLSQDNPFERMVDLNNVYPDYEDPEWVNKVTNWEEFWYENEDVLHLDDEDIPPMEKSMEGLSRAQSLIGQLSSLRKRTDVEQMIAPRVNPPQRYVEEYTTQQQFAHEMEMHRIDPNPDWNQFDVRAMAEKRRHKAIMDEEWRRQQSLLARPFSFTLAQRHGQDARLQSSERDWIREEWTHEDIMNLIVGGGKYVHPDKVPAVVMNPLLSADYHAAGVRAIPDAEEYIELIGHMATEDEILHLQSEVTLAEKDFVDPTLVFEDEDQNLYTEAPVNRWAQLIKARDAADVELFEAMVDKLNQRQARKEALAAEAEAGDGGLMSLDAESSAAAAALAAASEGYGGEDAEEQMIDDVYGEGFSEFMQGQDDVIFYADDISDEEDDEYDGGYADEADKAEPQAQQR